VESGCRRCGELVGLEGEMERWQAHVEETRGAEDVYGGSRGAVLEQLLALRVQDFGLPPSEFLFLFLGLGWGVGW
jgi:hypothetical protein